MTSDRGFIYAATGDRSFEEARRSVESLRRVDEDVPVVVFTERERPLPLANVDVRVLPSAKRKFRDKIDAARLSPFERTIFLDADTCVLRRLDSVFALLDHYDVAVAHSKVRLTPMKMRPNQYWNDGLRPIDDSFPELNTGLIAFRRNEATRTLLAQWDRRHGEIGVSADQVSFREVLLAARDVRAFILPPEFNLQGWNEFVLALDYVYVVHHHGTPRQIAKIARAINRTRSQRIFYGPLRLLFSHESLLHRALVRLSRH